MITALNKDLKPFEDLITEFAREELKPHVEKNDRYPYDSRDAEIIESNFRKIYDLGFLGIMLPEEYNGIGQGISALCMMLGHVAEVDASYSLIIFTSSLSQEVILAAGADKTAKKLFPQAKTAQDYFISFPSFTNPGQVVTLPQAAISGKDYKLTGNLDYLVLGNFTNWAVIPAKVSGKQGYSFFLVDLKDKAVRKSAPIFSLGLHACPIVDITFDGVNAQLLGEEGEGEKYFNKASKVLHVATAAISSGIMKGSLKEAMDYAKEREQGGWTIVNWSEVRMILANMTVKSKAVDMCVAGTCQGIEAGIPDWGVYSMAAAIHVHEMACEVVTDGIQVLGGNGYMKDYGQEKRYRDARQVQALLGLVPLRKLSLIREISA
ncbi:MAG: acyl-CoA/acyl-ACP dehydrogenase [Deltaproteobacteria bacterium]|nr:acyl-CoA/acyl-ACP dehydrogenase [Deltaproteobacteria bacterium]